jgi:hypothetical protein
MTGEKGDEETHESKPDAKLSTPEIFRINQS